MVDMIKEKGINYRCETTYLQFPSIKIEDITIEITIEIIVTVSKYEMLKGNMCAFIIKPVGLEIIDKEGNITIYIERSNGKFEKIFERMNVSGSVDN